MRRSKIVKLNRRNLVESMNKMPHECKDLILAFEQTTGERYKGVGLIPESLTPKPLHTDGEHRLAD